MENLKQCPLCSASESDLYLSTHDHFLSGEAFSIVQCRQCNFLYTNPRPVQDDSYSYYKSEEYISHSDSGKGLINQMYKHVRNHSLKQKTALIQKHVKQGSALDIGCGTGHFLRSLSSAGFNVQGIEPGKEAREYAIKNFGLSVESSLLDIDPSGNSYHVISMWHVLEHVYLLDDHLSQIHKMLNSDGILVVAVPNPKSYDAKVYGKYWAAYDLPRHIYHFTQESIQQLFNKHNFERIESLPMKFDAYYVSMLSEKYRTGKNNYPRAFMNGFLSNINAKRNHHNYSSLIYLFKTKIS